MTMQTPHVTSETVQQTIESIHTESVFFHQIALELSSVIIGNQQSIESLLITILCNGHALLEGVPGVAKTTMIKAITQALGLNFKRIQFTPDLLPADLIGSMVYNQKTQEFDVKKGPLFTNIVLADEINRAPAKVQSALLEAMQEHQVTIGNHTYLLDEPFLVFATQNPLEQEGTYRLPEAQLDRFLMKLIITYPSMAQEKQIIAAHQREHVIHPVVTKQHITSAQELVKKIYVDEKVTDYILVLISALRDPKGQGLAALAEYIACGPSPRATLALYRAAQAHAFLKRRHFVTPDDVKAVAHTVLRHRIILSYHAEGEQITSDSLITQVLAHVRAP